MSLIRQRTKKKFVLFFLWNSFLSSSNYIYIYIMYIIHIYYIIYIICIIYNTCNSKTAWYIKSRPALTTMNHSKFTFWGKLNQDTKHTWMQAVTWSSTFWHNYKNQQFKMNLYYNHCESKGKVFPVLSPAQQSTLRSAFWSSSAFAGMLGLSTVKVFT